MSNKRLKKHHSLTPSGAENIVTLPAASAAIAAATGRVEIGSAPAVTPFVVDPVGAGRTSSHVPTEVPRMPLAGG
jgi:hypothetical protein